MTQAVSAALGRARVLAHMLDAVVAAWATFKAAEAVDCNSAESAFAYESYSLARVRVGLHVDTMMAEGDAAELAAVLRRGEERDGMAAAFAAADGKHGHYEMLFAVAAWLLRHRQAEAELAREKDHD